MLISSANNRPTLEVTVRGGVKDLRVCTKVLDCSWFGLFSFMTDTGIDLGGVVISWAELVSASFLLDSLSDAFASTMNPSHTRAL